MPQEFAAPLHGHVHDAVVKGGVDFGRALWYYRALVVHTRGPILRGARGRRRAALDEIGVVVRGPPEQRPWLVAGRVAHALAGNGLAAGFESGARVASEKRSCGSELESACRHARMGARGSAQARS